MNDAKVRSTKTTAYVIGVISIHVNILYVRSKRIRKCGQITVEGVVHGSVAVEPEKRRGGCCGRSKIATNQNFSVGTWLDMNSSDTIIVVVERGQVGIKSRIKAAIAVQPHQHGARRIESSPNEHGVVGEYGQSTSVSGGSAKGRRSKV